jgi:low affinity Fe/Cu permease
MNDRFRKIAHQVSELTGTSWAFVTAILIILVWGVTGPVFRFSDTWQLIINTGTTIVTFLMVFLIQNTQNRDAKAMHLKLDELLRAVNGARTSMVDLEDCSDEELARLQEAFRRLRARQSEKIEDCVEAVEEELDEELDDREREALPSLRPSALPRRKAA